MKINSIKFENSEVQEIFRRFVVYHNTCYDKIINYENSNLIKKAWLFLTLRKPDILEYSILVDSLQNINSMLDKFPVVVEVEENETK